MANREPIPPARQATVDRARAAWISKLIDRSRRNILLFYRPLKTGTLDLAEAEPDAFRGLLAGQSTTLLRLLPNSDLTRAAAIVQQIRRRAQANEEEKGIETLFLALGLASWPAGDGGRPHDAPVLLLPIEIEARGRDGRSFVLRLGGEPQVNLVLLQELEQGFGLRIEPEAVLGPIDDENAAFDPEDGFGRLKNAANAITDFAVRPAAVLGNFAFQKMAMVRDLRECGEELAAHDLIAALAGDTEARMALLRDRSDIDPRELDRIPPEHEFLVLDADASQQRVIANVLRGQDGVIHGPPGTGKSQTIVNLIAELAASGKKALFVAEKRAALDVVLRRLEDLELDHLALDLHGAALSRREVLARIGEALGQVGEALPAEGSDLHYRFADRRQRLNDHDSRVHIPRAPTNLSIFDMESGLLALPKEAYSTSRWRGEALKRLDRQTAEKIDTLLLEASGFESLLVGTDSSPWTGAIIPDSAAAEIAIDLASVLAHERWPELQQAVRDLLGLTALPAPRTLDDLVTRLDLVDDTARVLAVLQPSAFNDSLAELRDALKPGAKGGVRGAWAWCTSGNYRAAHGRARSHLLPGTTSSRPLGAVIAEATELHRRWKEQGADSPSVPLNLERVRMLLDAVLADVAALEGVLGRVDLRTLPIAELQVCIAALAVDSLTPHRIPRLLEIERSLDRLGAGVLLKELRDAPRPASLWSSTFRHAWLGSARAAAYAEDPGLAGFNGRTQDAFVAQFNELDRQRLALAVRRLQRVHAEHVIEAMNSFPQQADLIRREAAKRTRHMPLRKLLAAAPDVLTALFPCWMASPLAVSQLIGTDRRYFDIVLFDEASQVLPEDAAAALLRSSKAVVAGDRNQLPPTTFFASGDDEWDGDDDPAATEGFESLLDLMSGFVTPWPLDWHYRSKDERLIAFANHHIYRDRLITFPSAWTESPVRLEAVAAIEADGQEESPSAEVDRVVQLVLEHADKQLRLPPDAQQTLGVITLGIKHTNRIEAALDQARPDHPELEAFFDEEQLERFFVKNLERVQGDERDAIILSIGVGKGRGGKVDHRAFGPLNNEAGRRRLNVAITRARRQLTLVSAFTHLDIDPDRAKHGTALLRDYLQYTASGGKVYGDAYATSVPLNSFEADIADTLERAGIPVVPQWGASKYRIDLAAKHPHHPGQFVLAIECDGASYHATPTARDRDRLRQQHLEALGWRFHRIWSTDWFQRREEEIRRAQDAYAAAVVAADGQQSVLETANWMNPEAAASVAVKNGRGPRPHIPKRQSIQHYHSWELLALLEWIKSDGRLRTDREILDQMVDALGFQKRGARIRERLEAMIAQSRKRSGH